MPPGHSYRFSFSFSVFPFPFAVLRFPLPFRFVVFPFVSCITVAFSFRFSTLLDGGFWYFVSVLHPPALLASLQVCVFPLRAVFCLAFLPFFPVFFLFLSFFAFAFDLDVVCFILSFSCGYYAVSSLSVFAATRLACDMYPIRTYADLTVLLLSEVYVLFQLLCVLYSVFCFICFPPEIIFHSRVIGACPVTTDSVVAMS